MKKIVFLLIISLLILTGCDKKIGITKSSSELLGTNISETLYELEELGFKNIKKEELKDVTEDDEKLDTIVSISIDGATDFSNNQKYNAESEIVIKYHSLKEIEYKVPEELIDSVDIEQIKRYIEELGFVNVSGDIQYDLDPDVSEKEETVEVLIGFSNAINNNYYKYNSEIKIINHKVFEKYNVNLKIDFVGNLLFSKYGVDVFMDNERIAQLEHGEDKEFNFRLKEGNYNFIFKNQEDADVKGEIELTDIKSDTNVVYTIYCHSENISVNETEIDRRVTIGADEIKLDFDQWDFFFKNSDGANEFLMSKGFTNIKYSPNDIDQSQSYYLKEVLIAGKKDFKKKDVYKKNVAVTIVVEPTPIDTGNKSTYEKCPFKYACEKKYDEYDVEYYLIDVDNKEAYKFRTGDSKAKGGRLSGNSTNGFTINFGDGWTERVEFFGGWVTVTDKDGNQHDFDRTSADIVWKNYKYKIKNADKISSDIKEEKETKEEVENEDTSMYTYAAMRADTYSTEYLLFDTVNNYVYDIWTGSAGAQRGKISGSNGNFTIKYNNVWKDTIKFSGNKATLTDVHGDIYEYVKTDPSSVYKRFKKDIEGYYVVPE